MKQMHTTPVCGVMYIKITGKFSQLHFVRDTYTYGSLRVCVYIM